MLFSWILCSRTGSVGPFKSSPRLWGQCCLVNTVEAETLKAGGLGSVCCCFQALEKCTNHFSFLLSALLWKEEAHAHWQSSCLGLTLSLHCSALMGAHQLIPSSVECLCHVIRAHTECIFGLKQCFWRASFEDKGEWEGENEIQLEFWRFFYTDTHTENTQFSNLLLLFFLLLCAFDKNQFHFPMNKRCLLFFCKICITGKQVDRKPCHALVHSQNGCDSRGWARPRPKWDAGHSVQISRVGDSSAVTWAVVCISTE